MPTLFISHGGGPMPVLEPAGGPHAQMVAALRQFARQLPTPEVIVVVSAHWEAATPELTGAASPRLYYDYHGFPAEAYQLGYPCAGAPRLAAQLAQALEPMQASINESRGLDHGVFIPLQIMYPQAHIPVLQVSLLESLNPAEHIQLGQLLHAGLVAAGLADKALVLGSGFSFHNMRAFFADNTGLEGARRAAQNEVFQQWLVHTMSAELSESERQMRLLGWAQAPHARYCHPREEHLLPLHVCYGAAGRAADEVVVATVLQQQCGMFLWR